MSYITQCTEFQSQDQAQRRTLGRGTGLLNKTYKRIEDQGNPRRKRNTKQETTLQGKIEKQDSKL
jgi:hypothetical protein